VPKGPAAAAATVSKDPHLPTPKIPNGFVPASPALERLSLTIGTFLRPFFGFSLDIREFQDKNRHGELLASVIQSITILQEARFLCQNPPPM
jgi:hypothetical protein